MNGRCDCPVEGWGSRDPEFARFAGIPIHSRYQGHTEDCPNLGLPEYPDAPTYADYLEAKEAAGGGPLFSQESWDKYYGYEGDDL